jgi:heme A synthase
MASPTPLWLRCWSVLTVLATLPLLFLGAEVTTKGVGMSDPAGFRSPWELISRLIEAVSLGLRIEYSHRLAGMVVGTCTIVLMLGLWFRGPRWLGVLALALVCTQGVLGIFRVDLNALLGTTLALVHGLFAQIVIAALVSIAFLLSRGWTDDASDPAATSPVLRRASLIFVGFVFLQLVLGGLTRHKDSFLGPRGHLLGAFGVVAGAVVLSRLVRDSENRPVFRRTLTVLHALIGFQLFLGIETWLSRFHASAADLPQLAPAFADPFWPHWVRSAHYVVGTFVFATSVVLAVKANRRAVLLTAPAPAPQAPLEGVA